MNSSLSELQLEDSQSEPRFQFYQTISEYFGCMIEFCINVWDSTCDLCSTIWDWTLENLCYPCCSKTDYKLDQKNTKKQLQTLSLSPTSTTTLRSNLSNIGTQTPLQWNSVNKENLTNNSTEKQGTNNELPNNNISISPPPPTTTTSQKLPPQTKIKAPSSTNVAAPTIISPHKQTINSQQNVQSSSNNININAFQSPEPTIRSNLTELSPQTGTSAKSTPSQANTQTSSPTSNQSTPPSHQLGEKQLTISHPHQQVQSTPSSPEQQQQPPPIQKQQQLSSNKLPLPPKIEFVETGSIFGDRKRPTFDQNMLQIENGRFRSPGMSKVVRGPGGRNIRVSFVSGFPLIKSIDSRSSLSSRVSRKSIDSLQLQLQLQQQQQQQVINNTASIESRKQLHPFVGLKSLKSIKSINSIDGNERNGFTSNDNQKS